MRVYFFTLDGLGSENKHSNQKGDGQLIAVENIDVHGLARAVYNARNSFNSWKYSDSDISTNTLGERDLEFAKRLVRSGKGSERKFLRQITVSMDITAPLMWWKEMDQYKVATVTNSTSTMHKLTAKDFELSDFSIDGMSGEGRVHMMETVETLNRCLMAYRENKNSTYWRDLIIMLPESYNQMRSWSGNYENLLGMIADRSNHKLTEWRTFCEVIRALPYMDEFIL